MIITIMLAIMLNGENSNTHRSRLVSEMKSVLGWWNGTPLNSCKLKLEREVKVTCTFLYGLHSFLFFHWALIPAPCLSSDQEQSVLVISILCSILFSKLLLLLLLLLSLLLLLLSAPVCYLTKDMRKFCDWGTLWCPIIDLIWISSHPL